MKLQPGPGLTPKKDPKEEESPPAPLLGSDEADPAGSDLNSDVPPTSYLNRDDDEEFWRNWQDRQPVVNSPLLPAAGHLKPHERTGFVNSPSYLPTHDNYPTKYPIPTYTPCTHAGLNAIWKNGDIHLYGARGDDLSGLDHDFVVDLAGRYVTYAETAGFVGAHPKKGPLKKLGWSALAAHAEVAPYLELKWRDRQPPPVKLQFWLTLWGLLKQAAVKDVAFCCMGGHGRTGTALAAMMVASSGSTWTAKRVVDTLRELYCKKAVESPSQILYVEKLVKERDVALVQRRGEEETSATVKGSKGVADK